jgi:hypothetical protein
MHALGLQQAWTLPAIPPAADRAGFDAAMTQAVRAGRVVAWITAMSFVAGFAVLARRIFSDWRVALLATFAFAFSGGIAVHIRILRTEMIAAGCVTLALLLLMTVARRGTTWRPLWIGLASALCMLGMENKVHAILVIATLPLLLLPFGSAISASAPFWRERKALVACLSVAAVAALALWLASSILATGFNLAEMAQTNMRPLFVGRLGVYQTALAVWIAVGIVAFALIWRIAILETLASSLALIAGAALALLVLLIEWNPVNAIAVLNPVERMLNFADLGREPGTETLSGAILLWIEQVWFTIKRWTFVLSSSPRPTVFLLYLIVPGIVVAALRGRLQLAVQATFLIGAALVIDTLGVRRGLKPEYIIFTDPLIIIAGALLLDAMPDVARMRWAYPVAALLFAAHIAISQAEPVKHVLKKSGPEYICDWNEFYQPLLPMPYCPRPSGTK